MRPLTEEETKAVFESQWLMIALFKLRAIT